MKLRLIKHKVKTRSYLYLTSFLNCTVPPKRPQHVSKKATTRKNILQDYVSLLTFTIQSLKSAFILGIHQKPITKRLRKVGKKTSRDRLLISEGHQKLSTLFNDFSVETDQSKVTAILFQFHMHRSLHQAKVSLQKKAIESVPSQERKQVKL